MAPVLGARPITNLVNTHANGDHCYGNQLVAGAGVDIVSSVRAAAEMEDVTPATLHAMVTADLGPELSGYVRRIFGPFEFDGIEVAPPTRTFEGDARADEVGDRAVRAHRGRPGAHRRRRDRVGARPLGSCSPATSSSSAARRSSGRARSPTGSPRSTASSPSTPR